MLNIYGKANLNSTLSCGDKSITHRALMLSAIADKPSTITNGSICHDCLSTMNCLIALGATITLEGTTYKVVPIKKANSNVTLDCGNSGTTARLLAGLVAGLGINAKFVGDSSLMRRPMNRIIDPLTKMGCIITTDESCLMQLHGGSLRGINYTLPVASAQVKSCLMIASLFAEGQTVVVDNYSTRNHTELMVSFLGGSCLVQGNTITTNKCTLKASDLDVPQDMSTMIFLVVHGLFGKGVTIKNVGINDGRMGAINALIASGGDIVITNQRTLCNELRGDIVVKHSKLKPIIIDEKQVASAIDELPLLSVVASMTSGKSVMRGVGELKHKESNRIAGIEHIASCLSANCEVDGEDIIIYGTNQHNAINAVTSGDHRIAMSLAIAGLLNSGVTLDNYQCIDISCPNFWQLLGVNYKRIALLGGSNIAGSRSPLIYKHNCTSTGSNGSYQLVAIDDATDSELMQIINSYDGLNVTMPYKSRVAKLVGSEKKVVNTIYNGKNATNTDPYGFITSCNVSGIDFDGKNVALIGAGDTGEALSQAIVKQGGRVFVYNRTQCKADAINEKLAPLSGEPTVLVSCVPPCDYELEVLNKLNKGKLEAVVSLAYKAESYLKSNVDCLFVNGLAMLYFQAQHSFNCWHGVMPTNNYQAFIKEMQ